MMPIHSDMHIDMAGVFIPAPLFIVLNTRVLTHSQVSMFDSVDGVHEPRGFFYKVSGRLVMFPSNTSELWPGGKLVTPVTAKQGASTLHKSAAL